MFLSEYCSTLTHYTDPVSHYPFLIKSFKKMELKRPSNAIFGLCSVLLNYAGEQHLFFYLLSKGCSDHNSSWEWGQKRSNYSLKDLSVRKQKKFWLNEQRGKRSRTRKKAPSHSQIKVIAQKAPLIPSCPHGMG